MLESSSLLRFPRPVFCCPFVSAYFQFDRLDLIHRQSAKMLVPLAVGVSSPKILCSTFLLTSNRRDPAARCEASPRPDSGPASDGGDWNLRVGSPIVVVEAPATLKTATSMPSLRVNSGLVKPGDVGRILARKPKDVWAVRLAIGAYLLDGKHFKPLELDE